MIKGFIGFKEARIPFVMENYRMELFTDDDILKDFSKEYNFKKDYLLHGQYFADGIQGQTATFFVDYSLGNTCYLRCYIIGMLTSDGCYDSIGFQSPFLDDVFRYKYEYLDLAREGVNLALEPKVCLLYTSSYPSYFVRTFLVKIPDRKGWERSSMRKTERWKPICAPTEHGARVCWLCMAGKEREKN